MNPRYCLISIILLLQTHSVIVQSETKEYLPSEVTDWKFETKGAIYASPIEL
jgi:hypothetical protein